MHCSKICKKSLNFSPLISACLLTSSAIFSITHLSLFSKRAQSVVLALATLGFLSSSLHVLQKDKTLKCPKEIKNGSAIMISGLALAFSAINLFASNKLLMTPYFGIASKVIAAASLLSSGIFLSALLYSDNKTYKRV